MENQDLLNDLLLPFLEEKLILILVVVIRLLDLLHFLKLLKDHGLIKELIEVQDFREKQQQFKVNFTKDLA